MSSPVPLLRPPVPGGRSNSGTRTPRLTLGIPPSPSARPVSDNAAPPLPQDVPDLRPSSRPTLPKLSMNTPMGSQGALHQPALGLRLNTTPQPLSLNTAYDAVRSRSDSFHNASVPGSASSSTYSALSFAIGHKIQTPDPGSAISSAYSEGIGSTSMEREGSMGGLAIDLEALSLEKGRQLDVDDLDDDGWAAASDQKKILELGSLGEGAGGAVTRCILDGGKTVFALKVRPTIMHHETPL